MFHLKTITTMKKMLAVLTALLLMMETNVFAQKNEAPTTPKERPTTEQMARKATERMTQRLKLTDKQAEEVYEAVLERMRATEAVREQMQAAKSAEAEKMKSILSTEQFVRWAQSQAPHGCCPRMARNGQTRGAARASTCDAAPKRRGDRR